VAHEADGKELSDLEPLEVEKGLAERVLQKVVVPYLDKVDEHGALALALVRNQDPEKECKISLGSATQQTLFQIVQNCLRSLPSFKTLVKVTWFSLIYLLLFLPFF
jgi:hypothetical protein